MSNNFRNYYGSYSNAARAYVNAFRAGYTGTAAASTTTRYSRGMQRMVTAGQVTRAFVNRVSSFITKTMLPMARAIGNKMYQLWNTVWSAARRGAGILWTKIKQVGNNVRYYASRAGAKMYNATAGVRSKARSINSAISNKGQELNDKYNPFTANNRQKNTETAKKIGRGIASGYRKADNWMRGKVEQGVRNRATKPNLTRNDGKPVSASTAKRRTQKYENGIRRRTNLIYNGAKIGVVGLAAYGIGRAISNATGGDESDYE